MKSVLFHNPSNSGGGHFVKQVELMESLATSGVETYFVSPTDFKGTEAIHHLPDSRPTLDLESGVLGHLFAVLWYLFIIRPDQFVPFNILGGFVGGIVGIVTHTETILFVRGDLYRGRALTGEPRYRIIKRGITMIEWMAFRMIDRIVFISEQNRKMMLDRTGLNKNDIDSVVLYNNVLTDRVNTQIDSGERELSGNPVIGFAGEFPADGCKGVADLIDAAAILLREHPNLELYLLGRGDGREALEQRARRRGIEDHVHVPGWVNDPIQYIMSFDLYVLPSYHEGLGNSLLEALACETPIAGSDVGGIPEVVYDRKYVFEPGDPIGLASVVSTIFESSESYEEAVANCRDRREVFDFSWAQAASKIVSNSETPERDRIPSAPIPNQLGDDYI
jgi:glycosyltransferase involved in cell wall biosynthesis